MLYLQPQPQQQSLSSVMEGPPTVQGRRQMSSSSRQDVVVTGHGSGSGSASMAAPGNSHAVNGSVAGGTGGWSNGNIGSKFLHSSFMHCLPKFVTFLVF